MTKVSAPVPVVIVLPKTSVAVKVVAPSPVRIVESAIVPITNVSAATPV